ncbi:unnamed protein product [Eretmochelys imbricata]
MLFQSPHSIGARNHRAALPLVTRSPLLGGSVLQVSVLYCASHWPWEGWITAWCPRVGEWVLPPAVQISSSYLSLAKRGGPPRELYIFMQRRCGPLCPWRAPGSPTPLGSRALRTSKCHTGGAAGARPLCTPGDVGYFQLYLKDRQLCNKFVAMFSMGGSACLWGGSPPLIVLCQPWAPHLLPQPPLPPCALLGSHQPESVLSPAISWRGATLTSPQLSASSLGLCGPALGCHLSPSCCFLGQVPQGWPLAQGSRLLPMAGKGGCGFLLLAAVWACSLGQALQGHVLCNAATSGPGQGGHSSP